ncbi:hypothetical protein ACF1ZH_001875 [Campylobacter coli]|nr:hypothetical protein [Campylobacter coli]EHV9543742.1 hypothetical protein [Campylobacter coli]EIA1257574.1 hypothetical protein [Campylobacter coli]EIZ6087534.1 hypothetical protein [Campylobacter coli]EJU5304916.1 hypothetical protein [Campylobacter coli]
MDKVEVKLKKSKMTTTEKLILTLWLSCGVAAIVLLLVYLKIITSFIGILGLLSVSSLVIAFVLFLAKNIKIVPYDEKKHGGYRSNNTHFSEFLDGYATGYSMSIHEIDGEALHSDK